MVTKIPTMLGTLIRIQPNYKKIIMKYNNYEECFNLAQNWVGFIIFTKKYGTEINSPFIHISSIIKIEQSSTCYSEQFDYILLQHKYPSIVVHHFCKKNKQIILPNEIPTILFRLLSQKTSIDTIYSSNPIDL